MKGQKQRISLLLAMMLLLSFALPLTAQAWAVQQEMHTDDEHSSWMSRNPDVPKAEITNPTWEGTVAFVDKLFYLEATVIGGSDIESLTWSVSDPDGRIIEQADVEYQEDSGWFRFLPVSEDAGKTLVVSVWPTGYPEAASIDSISLRVEEKPMVQLKALPTPVEAGEEVTVTATITDYPVGYGNGTINCTWGWGCPGYYGLEANLPDEMAYQTLAAASGQPLTSTITFTVPTTAQLSTSGEAIEGIDVWCYLTFRPGHFAEIEPNADQSAEIMLPLKTPVPGSTSIGLARRPYRIAPGEDMTLWANVTAAPAGSELIWSVTGEYADAVTLDSWSHVFSTGEMYPSIETTLKTSPDIPYGAQQHISAKLVKDGVTLAESEESPLTYEYKLELAVDPLAPKYGDQVTVSVEPVQGAKLSDWEGSLYIDVGQDWENILVVTDEVYDKETNTIVFRMPTARLPLTVDVWGTVIVDGQERDATAWMVLTPSGVQPDGASTEPSPGPSAEPSDVPTTEPSPPVTADPSASPSAAASVSPIEPNPEGPLPDLEIAGSPDGAGSVLLGVPIGTRVRPVTVADLLESISVPATTSAVVLSANGEALPDDARVGTGCVVEVRSNDQVVMAVAVVVKGDVLGTGLLSIAQVVRLAKALNAEAPLEGVYLEAAQLTSGTHVNITDLVMLAEMLRNVP